MTKYKNKTGNTLPDLSKILNDAGKAVAGVGTALSKGLEGTGAAMGSALSKEPYLVTESNKLPVTGATQIGGGKEESGISLTPTIDSPAKSAAANKPELHVSAKNAADKLEAWEGKRPAQYTPSYEGELRELVSLLTGMDFSYDPETDAAYKLVRDQVRKNARIAMEDTLGKALSKTGGYSNSYGQTAAQTAYANELYKSVDYIPELYSAAYDRFESERDAIGESIELLSKLDGAEFDKYTEIMKQYLDEGEMLLDNYHWADEEEFDRFLDYAELLDKITRI